MEILLMPSLDTKNETKRKKHELKRAGLGPVKEKPKDMKHIQKEAVKK
jgi:hypothetical protein